MVSYVSTLRARVLTPSEGPRKALRSAGDPRRARARAAPLRPHLAHRCLVGGPLGAVVQRRQISARPVAPPKRRRQEVVGDCRVLREQAAVQVGADRVRGPCPFGSVLGVVAVAPDHLPERLLTCCQVGSPAVILEAHDLAEVGFDDDVADAAVGSRAGVARLHREDADAREHGAVLGQVPLAEELEPAADGEGRHPSRDRTPEGGTLRHEVVRDASLLAILPAADDEEVACPGVERVADVDVLDLEADLARLTAIAQRDRVAAIAVDVHHVRIQVRESQRQLAVAFRHSSIVAARRTAGASHESLKCSRLRAMPPTSAPAHDPRDLAPARALLRDVFGYGDFRSGQAEVVASVLAGRDTLAVMPTGGGKSICFQLPALLLDGLTIVVSPLLALMKDQVDALEHVGVAAAALNSTVPRDEQAALLQRAAAGEIKLLYVAPERFSDGRFRSALRGLRVSLLAIDEAHCVSQWGHDFRPSYRDLGGVRHTIGGPPVVALTATADPRVRDDIVARLGLRDPDVRVAGFDRPNLRFHAVRVRSQKEKLEQITELLRALDGEASAIVYCATRKRVEELTNGLQNRGIRCARYHAGLDEADRVRIQNAFARDSLRIIVATNAFGLGIDKPDVRLVVHHDIPESLEAYYQEAGRAGRDGLPAECVLYFAPRDRGLREFFIERSHPSPQVVLAVYRALVRQGGERVLVRDLVEEDDAPGVNAAVHALVESGLAVRNGPFARALRPEGEDAIDLAGLEDHRAHATRKLDAMQAYADSATCLRWRILEYFGEAGAPRACGNCGPCLSPSLRSEQRHEPADPLFEQLRLLRRRLAEEEGVPPFVIFSDATLRDMVEKRPRTAGRCSSASAGVGPRQARPDTGMSFLSALRGTNISELPPSEGCSRRSPYVRRDGASPPRRITYACDGERIARLDRAPTSLEPSHKDEPKHATRSRSVRGSLREARWRSTSRSSGH